MEGLGGSREVGMCVYQLHTHAHTTYTESASDPEIRKKGSDKQQVQVHKSLKTTGEREEDGR